MKKTLLVLLSLTLIFGLAACSAGAKTTTGLGHIVTISATDATADEEGKSQVNAVFAAATFENDKVVAVQFDNAQVTVSFDANGAITSDISGFQPTKKDLGSNYGMRTQSGIGREWDEQISELEQWMVGKTVSEISGMPTKSRDESHPRVADVADLHTKVTIDVGDYLDALVNAYANAK